MRLYSDIDFETGAVDAYWLEEWTRFGLAELDAYLELHARFERYCDQRAREESC